MPGFFDIEADDIKRLSDLELTKLLEYLISNELAENNVRRTDSYVSLDITVPDGGADGLVLIKGDAFPQMDHILSAHTVFQAKAGTLRRQQFVSELFRNGSGLTDLKPQVKAAMDSGGSYVLFYGKSCLPQTKSTRIADMLAAVAAVHAQSTLQITILDCSDIAHWTNRYSPAKIRVASWVHRESLPGFTTWHGWSQYEYFTNTFFVDEETQKHIDQIRSVFTLSKQQLRVVGQSGLGKSRLVLEAFRPPDTDSGDPYQRILSNAVIYVDCANVANVVSTIIEIRSLGLAAILVADNCDMKTHEALVKEVRHSASLLSLISIDYHVTNGQPLPGEIRLRKASIVTLKRMLAEAHPRLQPYQLELVARYADGYPKIAAALAEARLEDGTTFDTHLDETLTEGLLWGRSQKDESARAVIQSLALFLNVGFEDSVASERHYIAEHMCALSKSDFYAKALSFSPRILDIIGDFVRVSPLPLAVRLAESWYEVHDKDDQLHLQTDEHMPPRLRECLGDRFESLGELEQAREIARRLLEPNAPFGRAEALNTEEGSRAFRSLAAVNPQAAMDALVREFGNMPIDALREHVGPGRRNLIWALESLAFNREQFMFATQVLARFAVAENEQWNNNATGCLLSHFQIVLAGTEATPELRVNAADSLLTNNDERFVSLGVRAMGRAVTEGGGRMLGAEEQGGRVLKDWYPSTNGDIYEYLDAAMERLSTYGCRDDEIGEIARERLAKGIPYVLRYRPQAIDRALKAVTACYHRAWPSALDSIQWSLQHAVSEAPEEIAALVRSWLAMIQPTDFKERVRLIVSIPPSGSIERKSDGSYVNLSQEAARALAEGIGSDRETWREIVSLVSSGRQDQAFSFGFYMARVLPENEQGYFATLALSALAEADAPNPNLLSGLLGGYSNENREHIKTMLKRIVTEPRVAPFSAKIMSVVAPDEEDLNRLLPLLEQGVLNPDNFKGFAFSSSLRNVSPPFVGQYFRSLLKFGVEGAQAALFVVSMYTNGEDKKKWTACKSLVRDIVTTRGIFQAEERDQLDRFALEEAINALLREKSGVKQLAAVLAAEIVRVCKLRNFNMRAYDVMRSATFSLLNGHQDVAWPIFKKALFRNNGLAQFHFRHLFERSLVMRDEPENALLYLKDEQLKGWCVEQPAFAPAFLAGSIPLFDYDGEEITVDPLALYLLDNFGDDKTVLSNMGGHIESFSNVGSLVPAYTQRLAFMRNFLGHRNPEVAQWAAMYASSYEKRIKSQERRDVEQAEGIMVPFHLDD